MRRCLAYQYEKIKIKTCMLPVTEPQNMCSKKLKELKGKMKMHNYSIFQYLSQ